MPKVKEKKTKRPRPRTEWVPWARTFRRAESRAEGSVAVHAAQAFGAAHAAAGAHWGRSAGARSATMCGESGELLREFGTQEGQAMVS